MSVNQSDMVFLAHRMNTFIDLVQDPQDFFKRNPDAILLESFDLKITAAALYLLVDCYLSGKGLKYHPRSRTRENAMEALAEVVDAVDNEVEARPYLYPKLCGALGRGQAAVELDWLMDGYSKWSDEGEIDEDTEG